MGSHLVLQHETVADVLNWKVSFPPLENQAAELQASKSPCSKKKSCSCLNGYRDSVSGDEQVLRIDVGDGYLILWMYLRLLNYKVRVIRI